MATPGRRSLPCWRPRRCGTRPITRMRAARPSPPSAACTVSTEQQRLIVAPGQAILIPPHHRHGLDVHGPCRGWSVYIAEAACAALPLLPQVMQVSGLLREAVLRASGWCDALSLDAAQARVAAVILDEIATLPRQRLVLPLPADRRLLKIARQLIADPADQRPLLEWAAWAGIAPRTRSDLLVRLKKSQKTWLSVDGQSRL